VQSGLSGMMFVPSLVLFEHYWKGWVGNTDVMIPQSCLYKVRKEGLKRMLFMTL
jgi:hypothetical protein